MNRSKLFAGGAGALMLASTALVAGATGGTATAAGDQTGTETRTFFTSLNNSGVRGMAEVDVRGRQLDIDVDARGLLAGSPHAQHIHFGAQARHECPDIADDVNGDFRLNTTEGAPAYGPIRVSFTTRGDTSPASGLAVDRLPTAPKGAIHYDRQTRTGKGVARAIRNGEAVVVIHGIDYNDNGKYDFKSAGKSELDPNLPAEATDPVACGVLRVQ